MHADLEAQAMVPARRAAEIAGISPQRLWYWEKTALITPTVRRDISPRNIIRLYSLDRLTELVVAAEIVDRPEVSLQHLRAILRRLRSIGYDTPLRELVFAIEGKEVFFQHQDGTWEGSRRQGQLVEIKLVVNLERVRQTVQRGLRRPASDIGRTERRRAVHGSKELIAGTRVPVAAVESYIEDGRSDDEVLAAFPSLDPLDVASVRERHKPRAIRA